MKAEVQPPRSQILKKNHFKTWLTVLVSLCAGGPVFASSVTSTFDSNSDGWVLAHSDPDSTLVYQASGGNPGGYTLFTDAAEGSTDVFSAPAKFLGNDSADFTGSFSFDLLHDSTAENIAASPLTITDAGGDTLTLILTAPAVGTWTSYHVVLDTSSGFLFDGGAAATQGQMQTVLSDVTSIYIPADIHTGTETTGLDNVALVGVPEPHTWVEITLGLVALLLLTPREWRKTGER